MKLQYRPDIDGMRTVAVLPILLFHAGVGVLGGGFVGVDIFFVISGYLITAIMLHEIVEGKFSVLQFYHRRVARIFPALFAMLVVTLLAGLLLLLPSEIKALGYSAAAASAFAANLYFWETTDYFAQAAEATVLLHTWSLGVEEQFYLFYPLVLVALVRFLPTRLKSALWFLVTGSFLVGGIMTLLWPASAFYLIPSRAWQLGLGGLIAAGAFPKVESVKVRQALSIVGALLIVAAYVLIRPDMKFPVPWGLMPCAGAALLIAFGPGTGIARLLGFAPMVAIGRISYSLYLWHWPIITFYRLEYGLDLNGTDSTILIVASFVAAMLSYFLVERPALSALRKWPGRRSVVAGIAGVGGMVALSLAVPVIGPLQKINPSFVQIASFSDYRARSEYQQQFRRGPCFRSEGDAFRPDLCYALADDRPNMVIMGDSHAAQYWRALVDRFPSRNVIQATASGCRPLLDGDGSQRCLEVMDYIFKKVLPTGKVSTLIIAGRWADSDLPGLKRTLVRLRQSYPHLQLVLVGPSIEYEGDFPLLLARALMHDDLTRVRREIVPKSWGMEPKVAGIAKATGTPYVSVRSIICPRECRLYAPNGSPMQFDYGHLTLTASRWVISQVPESMF